MNFNYSGMVPGKISFSSITTGTITAKNIRYMNGQPAIWVNSITGTFYSGGIVATTWVDNFLDAIVKDKPKPNRFRHKLMEKLPDWMSMAAFKRIKDFDGLHHYDAGRYKKGEDGIYRDEHGVEYMPVLEDVEIEDALLVSSKTDGGHYVILDIDFPVKVIPSSSPNKNHVYIDKIISDEDMEKLIKTLVEVGLVNEGIYDLQWVPTQQVSLRLPWVKKGIDRPFSSFSEQLQDAIANDYERVELQPNPWDAPVEDKLTPESPF